MSDRPSAETIRRLVLVPALVTLGVTLLRLTGELLGWSPRLFDKSAGGGGAVVGIVWLVPVFGIYFALKLLRMGYAPASRWRALGYAGLALAVLPVLVTLGRALGLPPGGYIALFAVGALVAGWLAYLGWPALGGTLLAYGLAARIPVALIMLVAIYAEWGTHYELGPPGLSPMGPFAKWVAIGLVPQLTFWIGFTMAVGALFGGLAAAIARREPRPATA